MFKDAIGWSDDGTALMVAELLQPANSGRIASSKFGQDSTLPVVQLHTALLKLVSPTRFVVGVAPKIASATWVQEQH